MLKLLKPVSSNTLICAFYIVFFCAFFSPAVFSDRSLAIADGSVFYHPLFEEPFGLWQHDQMSGFPAYADPQYGLWYPIRWIAPTYDLFIVSAYVLGAIGSHYLARHYGCSIRNSLVAGLVFGLSGFMTSHLGHATIVQASAWLPLMILAVEKASDRLTLLSISGGAVALSCSLLAGHPQISIYSIGLCIVLMMWNLSVKARTDQLTAIRLAGAYVGMIGLGLALAWIQLWPTMSLADETLRSHLTYNEFHSFSLPSSQLLMIVFPHLFGYQGTAAPNYFGEFNYVELIPYIGMTSLIVIIAATSRKGNPKRLFWAFMAIAAALYAISEETLIGELAYRVPVLNDFRAPARTALILTMSASILVAISLDALDKSKISTNKSRTSVVLATLCVVGSFLAAVAIYPWVQAKSAERGIDLVLITSNPAVLIPLGFAILATGLIWLSLNRPRLGLSLVSLLIVTELSWTGYKAEWVLAQKLSVPNAVDTAVLIADVKARGGRVLSLSGADSRNRAVSPNSNIEFDLPMVGSYGPLLPRNFSDLTGMDSTGKFQPGQLNLSMLQVVGASHIVFNEQLEYDLLFNRLCGDVITESQVAIRLSNPVKATHLRVTSNLGCSVGVEQATPVLNIAAQMNGITFSNALMKAGIDTAEWAIKREDVAPAIRHEIPKKTSVLPGTDGIGILSHSDIPLTEFGSSIEIDSLQLTFLLENGALSIKDLELVDLTSGEVTNVQLNFANRWRTSTLEIVGHDDTGQAFAEFKPWLGYAWLVEKLVAQTSTEATQAIRAGRLRDGSPLSLSQTALVTSDDQLPLPLSAGTSNGKVSLLRRAGGEISLGVATDQNSFLVISERYHEGWTASVNGDPVKVFRTNSEFMGLSVPLGKSIVTLNFHPVDLARSAIVTLLALLVTGLLITVHIQRRLKLSSQSQ